MKTDRRTFLALGTGAFVVATLPWARARRLALVRRQLPVMGTVAEFAVVSGNRRAAHAAIDAAYEELELVDRAMSRFRKDSDVGRLNRSEATTVSAPTATVLAEALRWAHGTAGAFDPCVGRTVELWDVHQRVAPPEAAAVRTLAGRHLYRALEIEGRSVRRNDPDAAIDLGGIAKGYAVDRAVQALRARGIEGALINVGGDLYALGRSEHGDQWRIGVRDPADPQRLSARIAVEDRAVATSGDYEQFFTHRGRHYHHLLDPKTGAPHAAERHSLTVTASTCMAADAAATALFGAAPTQAERTLRGLDRNASIVT